MTKCHPSFLQTLCACLDQRAQGVALGVPIGSWLSIDGSGMLHSGERISGLGERYRCAGIERDAHCLGWRCSKSWIGFCGSYAIDRVQKSDSKSTSTALGTVFLKPVPPWIQRICQLESRKKWRYCPILRYLLPSGRQNHERFLRMRPACVLDSDQCLQRNSEGRGHSPAEKSPRRHRV